MPGQSGVPGQTTTTLFGQTGAAGQGFMGQSGAAGQGFMGQSGAAGQGFMGQSGAAGQGFMGQSGGTTFGKPGTPGQEFRGQTGATGQGITTTLGPTPSTTTVQGFIGTTNTQGFNGQRFNGQGFAGQGSNGQSFTSQGFNGQGFNGQGFNGQGFNGQGFNGQGFNGQGFNGQGFTGQGFTGQSFPGQGMFGQRATNTSFQAPHSHAGQMFPGQIGMSKPGHTSTTTTIGRNLSTTGTTTGTTTTTTTGHTTTIQGQTTSTRFSQSGTTTNQGSTMGAGSSQGPGSPRGGSHRGHPAHIISRGRPQPPTASPTAQVTRLQPITQQMPTNTFPGFTHTQPTAFQHPQHPHMASPVLSPRMPMTSHGAYIPGRPGIFLSNEQQSLELYGMPDMTLRTQLGRSMINHPGFSRNPTTQADLNVVMGQLLAHRSGLSRKADLSFLQTPRAHPDHGFFNG